MRKRGLGWEIPLVQVMVKERGLAPAVSCPRHPGQPPRQAPHLHSCHFMAHQEQAAAETAGASKGRYTSPTVSDCRSALQQADLTAAHSGCCHSAMANVSITVTAAAVTDSIYAIDIYLNVALTK